MNSIQLPQPQLQDRFGRQVAARLAAGSSELPYEISERLRAARAQALVKRKRAAALRTAPSVLLAGGAAILTAGDEPLSWWNRIASALPILALVAGLVLIHSVENERRASEVAEVDAALLTDDLPPSAYADSGFIQFLKQSGKE
jgi:hypothetical protein